MEGANITPSDSSQFISPQEWINLLKKLDFSHQSPEHQYIVTSTDGKNFQVMSQKEIKDAAKEVYKLSLADIVQTSKMIFERAQSDYTLNQMEAHLFLDITKQIAAHTERLIKAREEKRERISKKMIKGLGWGLFAAASIAKVGNNFYHNMKQDYDNFQAENQEFRKAIGSLNESKFIKEITQRLEKIPEIVAKAKKDTQEENIAGFITRQIVKYIQEESKGQNQVIDIFDQDIKRGLTFLREDHALEIEDKFPIPSHQLESNEKVRVGIQSLIKLTQSNPPSKKDDAWLISLQVAVSKTSLTALFDILQQYFTAEIRNKTWKENDKDVGLILSFTDELPPIHLEIMRHHTTKEIIEVKVAMQGKLNLLKTEYSTQIEKPAELIVPQAILGKLVYSITLAKNLSPVISNVSFNLKSNLSGI